MVDPFGGVPMRSSGLQRQSGPTGGLLAPPPASLAAPSFQPSWNHPAAPGYHGHQPGRLHISGGNPYYNFGRPPPPAISPPVPAFQPHVGPQHAATRPGPRPSIPPVVPPQVHSVSSLGSILFRQQSLPLSKQFQFAGQGVDIPLTGSHS